MPQQQQSQQQQQLTTNESKVHIKLTNKPKAREI